MLRAKTIVIVTANDIERIEAEMMNRFGVVLVTELPARSHAKSIWEDMVEYWDLPKAKSMEEIGKSLISIKNSDPQIPLSVRGKTKELGRICVEWGRKSETEAGTNINRVGKVLA